MANWTKVRFFTTVGGYSLLSVALLPLVALSCECKPRTLPGEREGTGKKTPTYEFSWYSDADKKEDDRYCYERVVTNKHERSNLDYEWKVAEMENKALPPKERDRICKIRGAYREPAATGDLFYGRNNPPIDTEVWRAKLEPQRGETSQTASFSPLEAVLEFVFEVGGRNIYNSVILRSFVSTVDTTTGRTYRYRYLLENLREEVVVLSWIPELPDIAKVNPELSRLLRETSEGLAIEIRGLVAFRLESKTPPALTTFPVRFFEPRGKRMATGSAEAYTPPK